MHDKTTPLAPRPTRALHAARDRPVTPRAPARAPRPTDSRLFTRRACSLPALVVPERQRRVSHRPGVRVPVADAASTPPLVPRRRFEFRVLGVIALVVVPVRSVPTPAVLPRASRGVPLVAVVGHEFADPLGGGRDLGRRPADDALRFAVVGDLNLQPRSRLFGDCSDARALWTDDGTLRPGARHPLHGSAEPLLGDEGDDSHRLADVAFAPLDVDAEGPGVDLDLRARRRLDASTVDPPRPMTRPISCSERH